MRKLKDVMTKNVQFVSPDATIQDVAGQMKKLDCGSIPVGENDRLIGMITDRDIALRAVAEGRDPSKTLARDVMSHSVVYSYEDEECSEAAHIMEAKQIRRLIVLNRDKRMVGIVTVGDLSRKAGSEQLTGEIMEKVSQPAQSTAA
ncbi:MAG: CBS domain-containing protein [Bdellovibrionota bacterium]